MEAVSGKMLLEQARVAYGNNMVQMTGRMAKLNGAAAGVRDEWMMMKFVIAKMTASWREATLNGIPNTRSNIPRNTMLTPTNVALHALQHTS